MSTPYSFVFLSGISRLTYLPQTGWWKIPHLVIIQIDSNLKQALTEKILNIILTSALLIMCSNFLEFVALGVVEIKKILDHFTFLWFLFYLPARGGPAAVIVP